MARSQEILEGLKKQLGYNDAQWELWKSNPKNMEVIAKMEEFGKYKVVAEVINAYGCAMEHKVGDKLIFSGLGGFVSKEPPGQVCVGALGPVLPFVGMVLHKIAEGIDPQKIIFNRVRCTDVGVENGGWGEVLMEVRVEKT
ncbi:MAG: hypothetical protein A3G93_05965 [Nitrospinae bacterium RIFCSPLOWO2_12_FULL_45_22]|nr:MAG: hypothetical protein A3G93_05965 [Nitrospinae bacterium RIFCSPLOWO2_12_FULL_45_22]